MISSFLLVCLSVADSMLTRVALDIGGFEGNPFLLTANPYLKVCLVLAVIAVLHWLGRSHIVTMLCIGMAFVCAWNTRIVIALLAR